MLAMCNIGSEQFPYYKYVRIRKELTAFTRNNGRQPAPSLADREGPVPVGGGQVLGHLRVHSQVLHTQVVQHINQQHTINE